MTRSPYLVHEHRLADVIAAIQAMGTYKFYCLSFAEWGKRISGDEDTAEHWRKVFEEHPEFFRLGDGRNKASLVWRRQHRRLYHVDQGKQITRDKYRSLSAREKQRVTRTPLTSSEVATLIDAAIHLHSRAMERKRESRWWVGCLAGLIGVVLGAWIKAGAV